jgi:aryl-alcohol dehydrogenase-like predicted oxidoreductase
MGCWAIGGPWRFFDAAGDSTPAGWSSVDDAASVEAIRAGLDAGVTLFDTAANYGAGHSERVLSQALGKMRDQVVIATKFGFLVDSEARAVTTDNDQVLPNLVSDCEASLRRLGRDWIDLYQLHVADYSLDLVPDLLEALEGLVAAGKIRAYGWSTDDAAGAAAFAAGEHCTSVQFAYNVFSQKYAVRDLLAEADLGGLARSPLAMGILTGKMTERTTFPDDDVRSQMDLSQGRLAFLLDTAQRIRHTLTAGGHTATQGALAWVLTSDPRIVPIPGFKTAAQVGENVRTLDVGLLDTDQMIRIEGMRAASLDTVRSYYNPDASGDSD